MAEPYGHADVPGAADAEADVDVEADGDADGDADADGVWAAVAELTAWLDGARTLPVEQERLLRVLKVSEEAGEVAQAVIGALGQNPRKGRSHTWDDVQAELCDVILTAMVALRGLNPDARARLAAHAAGVRRRALG